MGANLINDKLRNQQHISESENLNKSTNKNPLYIVFSITDYYKKYNLKFHYWQRLLSIYTLLPYSFLPDSINNLFPNKHPSIHPRLLWIISSNSNNPLQSQSWLISIADDTVIPTSNPIHHFSFLPVTPGNKIPAGKSNRIFNRFSCNKPPSAVLPNLPHLPIPSISFHDQNTSN